MNGTSRNTGRPISNETWLKRSWPELLDAHYEFLGPSTCLQDAKHMFTEGKVRITCPQEKQADEEPRTLSELEVAIIKQWHDANKDMQPEEQQAKAGVTRTQGPRTAHAFASAAGSPSKSPSKATSLNMKKYSRLERRRPQWKSNRRTSERKGAPCHT